MLNFKNFENLLNVQNYIDCLYTFRTKFASIVIFPWEE